nr:hypothetical protein [Tanacetum cinerariifolium]
KPITPPSKSASEEDSDPEQAQRDKDMQKNLALIEKYFKKIYKPTNNNLKTSSNSRNKNVDTTPRYKNDNQTGQFGNQRTTTVAEAKKTVGGQPKRVKGSAYHKEKMLLCKQAEQGVPLQAEQCDWLANTDEEIDEQELEAHYSYMAKIQETQNDSFVFVHELKQEMHADLKYVESLEKEIDELKYDKVEFSNMYDTILQEFDSDHFACVTKMLNDMNSKTKKPNVVPISTRKPKDHTNKSVATPTKKTVASESTTQKSKSYYKMLYEKTKTTPSTPICLMDKASPTQAWLWHRRLSHLNFDYINLLSKKDVVIGLPKLKYVKDELCSSYEVSKEIGSSFKTKVVPSSKGRLNLLHMDLCGPMRVASINGKKYILEIVDDYSRYTWTLFLSSKDETPEVLKDFLVMIQRNLQSPVITAEAISTSCYTQNRSIIIPTHEQMAYRIINDRKPSIKHLHIFGSTCYLTRDGENLDKIKEKGDSCILVGYSTQSKGYRVYSKRTILIVECIHLKFDEIKEMSETFVANDTSGLVPQRQKTSEYDNSDPVP